MSESKGLLSRLRDPEKTKSPKLSRKLDTSKPVEARKENDKPTTPKVSRKIGLSISNEVKVTQNEVEEKLKMMRQKRLSRLNTHVDEQSKLSETRHLSRSTDEEDIEEAITSLQNHAPDKTANFKSIPEEETNLTRNTIEMNVNESPKKSSSTKRFISKFSCVNDNKATSVEELEKEAYGTPTRKSLPNKLDVHKMQQVTASKSSANLCESELFIRNNDQEKPSDIIRTSESRNFNHSFSENRSSIDMISEEIEKNKSCNVYPQRTITHETFGKLPTPTSTPKITEANFLEDGLAFRSLKDVHANKNTAISEEVGVNVGDEKPLLQARSRSDKLDHSLSNKTVESPKGSELNEKIRLPSEPVPRIYENINEAMQVKHSDIQVRIPRSPLPIPRKITKEDRILRKFQENFPMLKDILKNDSEIDYDEVEGFKHSLDEVSNIVDEYRLILNKVEQKAIPLERLRKIRDLARNTRKKVECFRGLQRDMAYLELSNTLLSYFFEVKKMKPIDVEMKREKILLLNDIDKTVRILAARVEKNEAILLQIFEEQVSFIQTKRSQPTLV